MIVLDQWEYAEWIEYMDEMTEWLDGRYCKRAIFPIRQHSLWILHLWNFAFLLSFRILRVTDTKRAQPNRTP